MTRTIEILVTATGQTTVQTKGFTGSSCREASRFLVDALGQRGNEQLTAEFHQVVPQQAEQQQRL